MTTYVYQKQLY